MQGIRFVSSQSTASSAFLSSAFLSTAFIAILGMACTASASTTEPSSTPSISSTGTVNVAPPPVSDAKTVTVDKVDDQTIYFTGPQAPKPLKTQLYDLNWVGTLKPAEDETVKGEKIPYFLFSASPCQNCSQEKALYLIRPTKVAQITSFVYPGRILDPRTHALVLESRAFYGQCLIGSDGSDQYVVYQTERIDKKHSHHNEKSVFVAQASLDYLRERLIERNLPIIKHSLARVKTKVCKEVSPYNRVMPIKPRGMNWKNLMPGESPDDTDDDDDSGEAESSPAAPQDNSEHHDAPIAAPAVTPATQ